MRKALIIALSLILMAFPYTAISQTDLSDVRAVHMGGNWGVIANLDWENENLSNEYIDWLKNVNANWVGISVAIHVLNSLDSTVKPRYSVDPKVPFTPTFTDAQLTTIIQKLRTNDFHVYLTLSFELELHGEELFVDRGTIGNQNAYEFDPQIERENWPWAPDHPEHETFLADFWQSYTDIAVHFAALAESLGVEMYSLGTETDDLFRTRAHEFRPNQYKDQLVDMVSAVRSVFSGLVTYDMFYAAVGVDKEAFGEGSKWLWQDLGLDVIGLSGYFPLTEAEPTSKLLYTDIKSSYERIFTDFLQPLQTHNPDIPIVFTEYGFTNSIRSPHISNADEGQTWVFSDSDSNDLDDGDETQANIYKAFYEVNKERGNLVSGTFLWGHDWASDEQWRSSWGWARMISMRDNLAEDVVREVYGSGLGSLSGTITDAKDGTPVYPVAVNLLDPDSGIDLFGLGTRNNADGSFEILRIPEGNYKLIINSIGDANAYIDELHSNIPCDNGGCDISALGDLIVITETPTEMDITLNRGFLLSGVVTDDSANPIPGVLTEVFDQAGNFICCRGTSDESGSWSQTVPEPGEYYVKTVSESAPGYYAEVWNDQRCEDCDPVPTGNPVEVVDSDVERIDFQLELKPPEVILYSGFE